MRGTILIDMGHYKSDSGAVANGFKEVDLNYSIAKFLGDALIRCGFNVVYSSGTLKERTDLENRLRPLCTISIHNNAGGGDGTEVFHYPSSSTGKKLATCVLNAIIKNELNNSRGVKSSNLHMLRETKGVAVLVECAFMDTADIQAVDEEHERKAFGEAVAEGACEYLGVPYAKEVQASNKFYRVCVGSFNDINNANNQVTELEGKGYKPFIAVYEK